MRLTIKIGREANNSAEYIGPFSFLGFEKPDW